MYETILVATDGSEPANKAVERALALASHHGAVVHVLSVVDTGRYGEPALSTSEIVVDDLEDFAHDHLADIGEQAAALDVELVTECCHGEPHETIVEYAEEIDADLTLLGRHGSSRTGHHIGSVADRVITHSNRPVQLV